MNVLMIGATGTYASLVVPELHRRGINIRALLRDKSQTDAVRQIDIEETVVGDLQDPESLRAAAAGVDGVFHLNPAFAPEEATLGVNMVRAAQAAGVAKFVFSSVYHPSLSLVNHAGKRPVEEALYESDMVFTILQPAMFMQNLDGSWETVKEQGKITMPFDKYAQVTYVDYRDVAEVAARAFQDDSLAYGTFELSAPGMVTRVEMADMMSKALGQSIVADETSVEDMEKNSNMPDGPQKEAMTTMLKHYDQHGFHGGNALVLTAILGREPRTLREYIFELAKRPGSLEIT